FTNLATHTFAPKQQVDTQRASVAQLEAQIRGDQAAIDSAQTQLDYTTIKSPLTGRTGIRLVDQGNIVHATDATGLVVVTQLPPLSVAFTLPYSRPEPGGNGHSPHGAKPNGPVGTRTLQRVQLRAGATGVEAGMLAGDSVATAGPFRH